MKPLYNQLMDSKSAPRVAPKAHSTQLGTAPMNLRTAMQKYASGGDVKKTDNKSASGGMATYDYNAPQNGDRIKIPGVSGNPDDGKVIVFWDHPNKRVVVSDEGYWNADSAVGDELKKAVDWAHSIGYQAGVVTTPYASDRFGDDVRTAGGFTRMRPPASDQQLKDYVNAADFVVTDPYILDPATSTPEMQNNFANFTKNVGDYANSQGKDTWLVLQGFNTPNVNPAVTQAYNDRLASENAGRYNNLSFYTPEEFKNGETPVNLQQTFNTATQAAQPFKMAEKIGVNLPTDWNNYGANDKINWFNNNNVSPSALAQAGVGQQDINYMAQNGYTGNTDQQPTVMAKAQPQAMTGITALGGDNGSYQSSSPQSMTQYELEKKYPNAPYGPTRQGGVTLDDGTFIAGVDNGQGGVNVGTPDFFQKYADNPEILSKLKNLYSEGAMSGAIPMGQAVATPTPTYLEPPRPVARDYSLPPTTPAPTYLEPPRPVATTRYDDPTVEAVASPYANNGPIQKSSSDSVIYGGPSNLGNDSPMGPDYSGAYAALGGANAVNNMRNQFLGMGLDENTIGSIFSQYYAPQQPVQQMARGGMAHSNIEQYLTRLGMVRK